MGLDDAEALAFTGSNHKVRKLIGRGTAGMVAIACVVLIIFYRLVGDTSVVGEAVTVFPPVLWLLPLALLSLPLIFGRSWRSAAVALACIGAFFLISEDCESLVRSPRGDRHYGSVRIITWNIAGRSDWQQLLDELEPLQPDLLFFQETPDGSASLTTASLSGYWSGFSWWDQGDCGILSRYPLAPLQSEKIGPWDKPALALVQLPRVDKTTGTLILCNVRLVLPSAALSPEQWFSNWDERAAQHEARMLQNKTLTEVITRLRLEHENSEAIVAGDFNTRGVSRSLRVLGKAGLYDAWNRSGTGWGATFMTELPMARIDQIWLSEKLRPLKSTVVRGSGSDHRLVVTDFRLWP